MSQLLKNKIKFSILIILIFFLTFFAFSSCIFSNLKQYDFEFIKFSTYLSIKIISNEPKSKIYSELIKILDEAQQIADKLDFYKIGNLLSFINEGKEVEIDDDILNFINLNLLYIKKTNGYFNPFIGNLTKLYNNFEQGSSPPEKNKLDEEIKKIKNTNLIIKNNENGNNTIIKIGNSFLNFGGSLKGYLIDIIYEKLKKINVDSFLINCGGDLRVYSKNEKIWNIGIQDPYDKSKIFTKIQLKNGSIVTSGNYERFFIYNGKRYFHILNPFTGLPDSDLDSITIFDESCCVADILSTGIFAMGKKLAIEFIKKNNIKALVIWKEDGETKSYNSLNFDTK
jgi:thiamine biosynthesis lipoprotein